MYQDPDELKEELQLLDEITTIEDTVNYVNVKLPGWVVYTCPDYADEYHMLRSTWHQLCATLSTTPKLILITQFVPFPNHLENHKVMDQLCDKLARFGFCVRRSAEMIPCSKCGKALLSPFSHNYFKTKTEEIPREWSETCQSCLH
jgi:hypothetical protein